MPTDLNELRGEIEKLRKPMLDKTDPDNYEACFARHGFNDALDKVLALLNK